MALHVSLSPTLLSTGTQNSSSSVLRRDSTPSLLRRHSTPVIIDVPKDSRSSRPSPVSRKGIFTLTVAVAFFAWDIFYNNGKILLFTVCSTTFVSIVSRKWNDLKRSKFLSASHQTVMALQDNLKPFYPDGSLINFSTLEECGHLPKHKFKLNNVTYFCSSIFDLCGSPAVFALVEHPTGVYPRIFYLSKSGAVWRTLPSISNDRGVLHFGKGTHDYFANVPIQLNFALHQLPVAKNSVHSTRYLLDMLEVDLGSGRFEDMIQHVPFVRNENMGLLNSPSLIQMPENPNLGPNFSKLLYSDNFESNWYGPLNAKVFPSFDGSRLFLFFIASDGKVFFAGTEHSKAAINIYGIRECRDVLSKMCAPLLEYGVQIERGYEPSNGNVNLYDCNSGVYSSNWNYVRELEIVKLFYKHHRMQIPDEV